jgi:hypothetical protein
MSGDVALAYENGVEAAERRAEELSEGVKLGGVLGCMGTRNGI